MNTLIPKLADSLGETATVVRFVSSAFAITALAIRPISGPASDSFSKKNLLMASQICIIIAFLSYSFAENVAVIVATRLLHGIGAGVITPLSLAMASNALPDHKLGSGIGVFSLGQAVAQAVGPTLGLSLSTVVGYSRTFQLGAAIMFVAFLFALRIVEPVDEVRLKFKIELNRIVARGAVKPVIVMFFLGVSYSCISSFLALYGAERGVEQIGLFFTAYAGTMLITRPISGKLIDKFGFDKVLVPGILFFSVSFILISVSQKLPDFILTGIVGACGYGVC